MPYPAVLWDMYPPVFTFPLDSGEYFMDPFVPPVDANMYPGTPSSPGLLPIEDSSAHHTRQKHLSATPTRPFDPRSDTRTLRWPGPYDDSYSPSTPVPPYHRDYSSMRHIGGNTLPDNYNRWALASGADGPSLIGSQGYPVGKWDLDAPNTLWDATSMADIDTKSLTREQLLPVHTPDSSPSTTSPLRVTRADERVSESNRSQAAKSCSHCHTISTPLWRREPGTLKPLCNACGLYLQQRHKHRPKQLIEADLDEPDSEDEDGLLEGASRSECSHCHTHRTSVWRRSKDGQKLCNACGVYLRLRGRERPLSLKRNKIKPRAKHGAVSK